MTFHIRRKESLDRAIRRIAREQIGIVIRDFENPELPGDVKIHGLRARCKKMRALLRLPGPLMCDAFAREDARFRDIARGLGGLRDEVVRQQTISELQERSDVDTESRRPATETDTATMSAALESMREALTSVGDWPLPIESFCDLAPGYARTYRKARLAWQRVLITPDDEQFHRLRKWSKYLWYQTRILERMNRKKMHRQRVRLQVLGEVLGSAHDLVVLESGEFGAVDQHTLHHAARRKQQLYIRALKLCAKTYRSTADEQVALLAGWWQLWRERQSSLPIDRKSTPSERSLR